MKLFLGGESNNESSNDPINESTNNYVYIIVGIVVFCIIIGISIFVYFNIKAKTLAVEKEAKEKAAKAQAEKEAKAKAAKEQAEKEAKAKAAKEQAEKEAAAQEQAATLVSKVRIEINKGKENYLQISQLVLLDNNNKIIKPIEINASESMQDANKYTANDGVRKPRPNPNIYHSSTNSMKTAFYEFIIPPSKIKTIEIYNREDCCSERIADFSLYLYNSNNTILKTFPLINLPVQIINIV